MPAGGQPPTKYAHRGRECYAAGAAASNLRRAECGRIKLRCGSRRGQMLAHLTICPEAPAGSEHVDRRGRCLKANRGHPRGPRMKCGWGRGDVSRRGGCDRISPHARNAAHRGRPGVPLTVRLAVRAAPALLVALRAFRCEAGRGRASVTSRSPGARPTGASGVSARGALQLDRRDHTLNLPSRRIDPESVYIGPLLRVVGLCTERYKSFHVRSARPGEGSQQRGYPAIRN